MNSEKNKNSNTKSFLLYKHNCFELAKYTIKIVDTPTYEYINGTEKQLNMRDSIINKELSAYYNDHCFLLYHPSLHHYLFYK